MSIRQFYRLSCDDHSCEEGDDATAEIEGKNRERARMDLFKRGWSTDGYRRDFCPSCTRRHQSEEAK